MKILLEKYPKGSYKGQKSDGRFMDDYLYHNLQLLASKIIDDMTFLGVCYSSTLEVGTGKSVLCTQIGEAWSEIMKKMHNIDVPFTQKNIVWRPEELIKTAFDVPQYSFILLDEWEDATYWSQLGTTLRQFFRKCRQLNLFIMVIIPNFFQFPMSYAISRSVFSIDVRFQEGFERGFFYFYDFDAKRKVYIKGKKEHNYYITQPTFYGRFLDGYGIPESEYRAAKRKDMMSYDNEEKTQPTEEQLRRKIFLEILEKNPEIPKYKIAGLVGVNRRTVFKWLEKEKDTKSVVGKGESVVVPTYKGIRVNREIIWDEGLVEETEDK